MRDAKASAYLGLIESCGSLRCLRQNLQNRRSRERTRWPIWSPIPSASAITARRETEGLRQLLGRVLHEVEDLSPELREAIERALAS
jgi:hypothetical protein